jgi:succinate dehydrogenase / fumarate reductase, cytochrome b subunit
MTGSVLRLSSVSKKVFLASFGLFLIIFLMVHLGINLLLLPFIRNDNGQWFRDAASFMANNRVVKVMEIVLMASFVFHIILALIVQIQNWIARPVKYAKEGFSHTSFFSKFMIHTGIVIFIFLVIHMVNFYFVRLGLVAAPDGAEGEPDFYAMARVLFANTGYSIFYLFCLLILSFHLNHAFQSAFQTLGINHNRWTPAIKKIGTWYSILIPLGFAIIPLYFLLT